MDSKVQYTSIRDHLANYSELGDILHVTQLKTENFHTSMHSGFAHQLGVRGHGKAAWDPQPQHPPLPLHLSFRREISPHLQSHFHLQTFILIALTVAKKIILNLLNCKDRTKLSTNHWLNLLTGHANLEKLTSALKDDLIPFHNTWSPFQHCSRADSSLHCLTHSVLPNCNMTTQN